MTYADFSIVGLAQTRLWAGRRTVKAVPVSSAEVTSMVPPWAARISRAMNSPRPRLVEGRSCGSDSRLATCTSGLKITCRAPGGIGGPSRRRDLESGNARIVHALGDHLVYLRNHGPKGHLSFLVHRPC